jgi:hypothetical protein
MTLQSDAMVKMIAVMAPMRAHVAVLKMALVATMNSNVRTVSVFQSRSNVIRNQIVWITLMKLDVHRLLLFKALLQ